MSTITGAKTKDQFRPGVQGQEVLDKAKDLASTAADKVKEAAGSFADHVSQTASAVGQKADHLASGAGSSIKNLGETIKDKGPQEGMLGSASKTVGNTIEEGGKYIEQAGLSGIADDLVEVVKRNPVPAVLVGLGIGLLIGRAFRS